MNIKERTIGGLIGLIVGDALGLPVQFAGREARIIDPVTGMRGYGTFNMPPGFWSDDSSMALCLAESLLEAGFDTDDMGRRFASWYREGYWTPTGYAYDIGKSTAQAMERLISGVPAIEAGPAGERDNGNGSLMRILPLSIFMHNVSNEILAEKIWDASRITHGHPRACSACYLYSILVRDLLHGWRPIEAYQRLCQNAELTHGLPREEVHVFERLLGGEIGKIPEDQIRSDGYVVHTLEASVWCLLNHDNFKDTILAAVNLGDDTDTTGAVAGGLAGIVYGLDGIAKDWVEVLADKNDIMLLAKQFAEMIKP